MTQPNDDAGNVSRRDFVVAASFTGVALLLGVSSDGVVFPARSQHIVRNGTPATFAPNQWLRIDTTGVVTIMAARSEMGQGVRTSVPMIVAEELGADWAKVRIEHAQPGTAFNDMGTSGSSSVSDSWNPLRKAAAAAREMLVAAAAAEWSVDPASCAAINHSVSHATSGRQLPFGELVARAAALPVPPAPTLKNARDYRLLGTRVPRVDAAAIVEGQAMYGLDARPVGVAVAVIARPPEHGAKVGSFADAAARAMPGVRNVVQVPTGVAVVADCTWTAMQARNALQLTWTTTSGRQRGSVEYARALEAAVGAGKIARREGNDFATAWAGSAQRLEATYSTPFHAHAAMEPLNCIADVHDDRCNIWVGTQSPNRAQQRVAALLGIPEARVTVNILLLGGGFGRRIDTDYVLEAVEISRAIRRPVQLVWTREDDMHHDRYQPAKVNRMAAGLDAAGAVVAWRHQVADYNLTMYGPFDPAYNPANDGDPSGAFDTPYSFPALNVTFALLESPVPTGAWRAVSYPASVFAREGFLDEVARRLKEDPVTLRLAQIPSPGAIKSGALTLLNGDRLRRVVALAAEKAGWAAPFVRERNGRRWGRGFACNAYHSRTMVAQVAEVSVGDRGDLRVHRVVCAVDCGQVINLLGVESQFESGVVWALSTLHSAIDFDRGRTRQSNFTDYRLPRIADAPLVDVHVVQSDLPPFGVGEQPVPPVIPAVMNAVFDATAVRVRRIPVNTAALAR